jgi:hypothetical protein
VRLYISGPITGLPDLNKPLFVAASAALRSIGHQVLNPHDVCTILDKHQCQRPCHPSEELLPWAEYLRADLIAMLQLADGLAMLPDWESSRGACLERHVAEALGMEVRDWTDWLVRTPVAP